MADTQDIISRIEDKLSRGGRLDFEDGLAMYRTGELVRWGQLAEKVTRARQGRNVYYSVNRHINYTNICTMQCSFCGFSRPAGQDDGYMLTVAEVIRLAGQAADEGATEVHIVGGIHPDLAFDYYLATIEGVRRENPRLHIKAFTAAEIIDLAAKGGLSVEQTLARLREAGLGSLPGGGAEILQDAYFDKCCPGKPRPSEWLKVHALAHQLGMCTNATMLFGYKESESDRIRHLLRLREAQDQALAGGRGKFQCFVPLPYVQFANEVEPSPGSGEEADSLKANGNVEYVDAITELKSIAVSRLMLDNFAYIKAFWPMLGIQTAQAALAFGANDLDGTVEQYQIVERQGGNTPAGLSEEQLRSLIFEADRCPVKRDGDYREI